MDRPALLGTLAVLPDDVLLAVFAFLDLKSTLCLSPVNSKLHLLLTSHDHFWRARTESIFGEPPLDLKPESWHEFFKLRYGLQRRMCYKGRFASSQGDVYELLITLFGSPNDVQGEEHFRKITGAVRWRLVYLPPGHWLMDKLGCTAHEFITGYGVWYELPGDVVRVVGISMDRAGRGFLALDQYELRRSYDGKTLKGVSYGDEPHWLNPIEGELVLSDHSDDMDAQTIRHRFPSYAHFDNSHNYRDLPSLVKCAGDRQVIRVDGEASFSVRLIGSKFRTPIAWTNPVLGNAAIITFTNDMGTYTQQAFLVAWSDPLQAMLEGHKEATEEMRCTLEELKGWGTSVQFSYAVNSV